MIMDISCWRSMALGGRAEGLHRHIEYSYSDLDFFLIYEAEYQDKCTIYTLLIVKYQTEKIGRVFSV